MGWDIRPDYWQQPGPMRHSSRLLAITGTDAPTPVLKPFPLPCLPKDLKTARGGRRTPAGCPTPVRPSSAPRCPCLARASLSPPCTSPRRRIASTTAARPARLGPVAPRASPRQSPAPRRRAAASPLPPPCG